MSGTSSSAERERDERDERAARLANKSFLGDVTLQDGSLNEMKYRKAMRHLRDQQKRQLLSKYENDFQKSGVYRRLWEES